MQLEFDKTSALTHNDSITREVEDYLLQLPAVVTVFSNIGGPSTGIGSLGVGEAYRSELTVQLKPAEERGNITTESYMRKLRDTIRQSYKGINYSITALGLIPRTAPIEIILSGSNQEKVFETGKALKEVIQTIPGSDDVQLSVQAGSPEFKVIPNQDKMQRLGLNSGYLSFQLRSALTGDDQATLSEYGTEYPIRIWLKDFDRRNMNDLKNLTVINPKGMPVKVNQFAEVVQAESPSLLERKNRQPAITLTADALGRPSGTVADDVVAYLVEHPLPEGIEMTWGSDIKRQNDSFGALGSVLAISFLLIYLIMVALYDDFIYPLVVLFSIPVAIIGAFLALNLSMSNLSFFALLGLIMLMGLVTKNAILIVDFTNQLKAEGKYFKEALIIAVKGRLRPILMTTLSMVFGMMPIALATGSASEWKNGLAWVIIGGLMSSLILTVFLVPVVYFAVDTLKEKLSNKKSVNK